MMKAPLFLAAAGALLLTACLDTSLPDTSKCLAQQPEIAATRGDTTVTRIGFRFVDTRVGTGGRVVPCSEVTIRYVGSLESGATFDSTYAAKDFMTFTAGRGDLFLPSVELGVIGMRVAGIRRLIIPPELGYGDNDIYNVPVGTPGRKIIIPANSTLIFDIELRAARPPAS